MNRRLQATCWAIALISGAIVFILWKVNTRDESSRRSSQDRNISTFDRLDTSSGNPTRAHTVIDPSIADHLGSDSCRECHTEIWEKYQFHPMANSFMKVADASPIEDYVDHTEIAPPGNRKYRVEKTSKGVLHHEIMIDQAGDVIYDQSVPVDYSIGSGKRGRGFVIDRDGLLFQSSISWYSDRNAWGLSPDYSPDHHKRFERRITGTCLTCHSGLPNFAQGETDRFGTPPVLEAAIGCERCHGPGRKHVAARKSGQLAEDLIVNPAHLDVDRRDAICAQCHLHGLSRILLTGRTPNDFRPGERLDANRIVFVKPNGAGTTFVASQVEHMVSSTCYQRSEGKMSCTSCHDPHSVPEPSRKFDYFRQKCLKCHADRGCSLPLSEREATTQLDNCIRCHMPSVSSANVMHQSIADHRILRRPSNVPVDEPGDSVVFQFSSSSIPESELIRAKAFKMINDALGPPARPELAQEANKLLMPLIATSPDDPELYAALGNSFQILNQLKESTRYRFQVLKLNPRHESTIQNLATLFHDQFQLVLAERYLKQFIELNPWHGSYHGRLAGTLMYRGDTKGAIASAERALELNPTLWQLHGLLSKAYSKVGDTDSAAKHEKLLLRMRPENPTP